MRLPDHPTLIRRLLDARLNKLASPTLVLAASLVLARPRCRRSNCRCHHDGPRHAAHPLSFKDKGKTRTVHVPKDLLPEVRSGVAQHQRIKTLLQEIHDLGIALVRTPVTYRRRRAGRP